MDFPTIYIMDFPPIHLSPRHTITYNNIDVHNIFEPETYIIKCISHRRHSLMSQFRTGILPLEINTEIYVPSFDKTLKKNRKRTANVCKLMSVKNDIENEYYFLCVFPVYNSRRKILFEEVELKHVHFHTLSLSDKFIFVMKHRQIEVSKFINETWSIRQTKLETALVDTYIYFLILRYM